MRNLLFICASLALVAAHTASGEDTAWTNRLVGTWTCVAATVNGKPLSESSVKKLRLTLTENRYKTERADEVLFDSTYHLDTSTTPTRIGMIGTEGDLIGKEARGILSLSSNTLTICYTMPGKARPLVFESPVGSETHLVVWKRN